MIEIIKNKALQAVAFLSSLGLAIVLFGLLMMLTYLGTLYQIEHGLFAAQQKYFESIFLIHHVFGSIPVPLPGAYLVLVVLFINLLLGGLLRMRRGWGQAGILVAHGGILLMLVGGFITFQYSTSGHMTLYEDERSSVYKSYHEWEVVIARMEPDGSRRELIVPGEKFTHLAGQQEARFAAGEHGFALVLSNYLKNSQPQPAGPMVAAGGPVVDGFYLQPLPPDSSQERNVAGVHAIVEENGGGGRHDLLLWGLQQQPAAARVNGSTWTFDLRRKQWQLPFTIVLDEFTRELHPRTNMPASFQSEVTKIENGHEERIKITMNQPLRHEGYTFYQASWGPSDAGPNDPLFSSFAVVKDPAENFPMLACIVVGAGLLLHFCMKLRKYLNKEQKRRPA